MKTLFLFLLAAGPAFAATGPAPLAEPIEHDNMYFGNIRLEPLPDGRVRFRLEEFDGQGVVQGDAIPSGARYVLTGTVKCRFGEPAAELFECDTLGRRDDDTALQLADAKGNLGPAVPIHAQYVAIVGEQVTTRTVNGTSLSVSVQTQVFGGDGLDLDLTQNFGK